MKTKLLFWSYVILAMANVVGNLLGMASLVDFTKVTLMPILIAYLYERTRGHVTILTLFTAAALIFSWLGDVALMKEGDTYFMLGLSSFLLAHLVYSYTFLRSIHFQVQVRWGFLVPVLLYGSVMLYLLVPKAGSLAAPIIVYALVICTAVITGAHRMGKVGDQSFRLVLWGILSFAISDSLLAWAKFVTNFEGSGASVMLTYAVGQLLIVEGMIKQEVGTQSAY